MTSRDNKPRTVPKFGSFKPKAPAKVESEVEVKAVTAVKLGVEEESEDRKRHKSHHRHRDGDRDDHRSHRQGRWEKTSRERSQKLSDRYPDSSLSGSLSATKPGSKSKDPTNELFTFDKRGDPLIVRYRSNERSKVPAYRRMRRGILLGSKGHLEIIQDGQREKFSIQTSREGRSAFRDKNLLAQAGKTKSRVFKNSTHQEPLSVDEDFIELEPARRRRKGEDDVDEDYGSDRDEGQAYRSIEGKAKPKEDSDSAFESDSDDAEGYYVTPAKRKAIELSRAVKAHPADIEAWLELIDLQDVLFKENEENDHVRTRDETKALADIKLSMFEKALPHAASNADREKLLAGLMREGARVWKSDKLAKRWAEVTDQNPDTFALWKSRMDFELCNIATFSFEGVKLRFVERLRYIKGRLSRTADVADSIGLAEQAVYVFLRLTRLLHEAGFLDLAVGAWQAMLELHFARPPLPEDSRESAMATFSEFWESEVPRLGEEGATGWRKFVEDGSVGDLPDSKPQLQGSAAPINDPYQAWAVEESRRALEARVPAKTVDEGTDDDPYRVVMFADIESLLVFFPTRIVDHARQQLLDAYLLFCQLPPAFGAQGTVLNSAFDDAFIYGGSRDFEQSLLRPPESIDISVERKRQPPNFKTDGSHLAISPDVLFAGRGWFRYPPNWLELYPNHDEPIERSYILTTLRQLVHISGLEGLAEYYLALEWINDPAGAKKVAKAVLKLFPSNMSLYNAYALVECANGNFETSRKVLQAATAQHTAPNASLQMLRNTWAWIELDAGQPTKALERLCSKGSGDTAPTPALVLKVKSGLTTQRDSLLSAGDLQQALHYATSLALLAYLSPMDGSDTGKEPQSADQGNITAALATCNSFSAELVSRRWKESPVHERFLQFAARLVYYHATHGPFRPIYIRSQLHRYVTLFPKNTIFLSIIAWAESSLRIDDPVRSLFRDVVLSDSHDCPSSRIFAIRYELQVGNAHSVRAAFESVLTESEACRGNSWLWLYYIRFCAARRRELKGRAKEVFYRAIAACPGAKRLYMEAFGTLRGEMSGSELEAVLRTLEDKGLRVHVEFEGFRRAWEVARGS